MTDPSETYTSMTQVSISEGCQSICRVDLRVEADLGLEYVLLHIGTFLVYHMLQLILFANFTIG